MFTTCRKNWDARFSETVKLLPVSGTACCVTLRIHSLTCNKTYTELARRMWRLVSLYTKQFRRDRSETRRVRYMRCISKTELAGYASMALGLRRVLLIIRVNFLRAGGRCEILKVIMLISRLLCWLNNFHFVYVLIPRRSRFNWLIRFCEMKKGDGR